MKKDPQGKDREMNRDRESYKNGKDPKTPVIDSLPKKTVHDALTTDPKKREPVEKKSEQ